MRAVDCQVIREKRLKKLISAASPGVRACPEQAVMHQEQVRLFRDRHPDCAETSIDRSSDAADGTIVLHLKSIAGSVPIGELVGGEQAVTIADDRGQSGFGH